MRDNSTGLCPGGRFCGLAILLALLLPLSARAQFVFPNDPVSAMRDGLAIRIRDPLNPDELKFRQQNLEKLAKNLRTLGQLRRTLLLQEWRDNDRDEKLAEVDRSVREQIIQRLTTGIRKALKDGSTAQRLGAISMIGEMGIPDTSDKGVAIRGINPDTGLARTFAPDLAEILQGNDDRLSVAAAEALGKTYPPPEIIAKALERPIGRFARADVATRRAAAGALVALIANPTALFLSRSPAIKIDQKDLADMGKVVVTVAPRGFDDEDAEVRRLCVEAMRTAASALQFLVNPANAASEFPPEGRPLNREEEAAIKQYRDEVEQEREQLKPLLDGLGANAPRLSAMLRDTDPKVRQTAAHALVEMGLAKRKLAILIKSVPRIQPDKASRLPELRPQLEPRQPLALEEPRVLPEPRFVLTADPKEPDDIDPLRAGLRKTLSDLAAALNDPDIQVRLAVVEALEAMEGDIAPVADALIRALDDCNRFVRWAAARTLGNAQLKDSAPVVAGLTSHLDDLDLSVRLAIAESLGDYRDAAESAVTRLLPFVNTDDVEMRLRAIQVLVEIGTRNKAAVEAITRALTNTDVRVRRAAVAALGTFGTAGSSAIGALEKALDDTDVEVRRNAGDALLAIQEP